MMEKKMSDWAEKFFLKSKLYSFTSFDLTMHLKTHSVEVEQSVEFEESFKCS